jgi:hypothetical protein
MTMQIPMNMKLKTQLHHLPLWDHSSWVLVVLLGFLVALAYPSYCNAQEADGTNCASGVIGLCTPGTFESSTSTSTETTQTDGTGITTNTTTTTETTTTTVTNPETGDLLTDAKVNAMGRNQKFGGDMTSDWGGQGPAKIRNGATCGDLGTDKCAEITGGSSFTSTLGQTGVGSTYKQTIDITHFSIDPDIDRGGQVPWSIRVEKRDASDSVHFRIRKSNGTTLTLLGTETLSAAGADTITNTLFQGNFDFSGAMTALTIEVSGRDINLAIGPLFDDVTVNVIYNVVNTIVTETITTIEQFIALGTFDQETINVAADIFENNDVGENDIGEFSITPAGEEDTASETSYETVSAEINAEIPVPTELQEPTVEFSVSSPNIEVQTSEQTVEVEIEVEMKNDIVNNVADGGNVVETESSQESGESVSDSEQESKAEPSVAEVEEQEEKPQSGPSSVKEKKEEPKTAETKTEEKKEPEIKVADKQEKEKPDSKPAATKKEQKQEAKEKAASKIVKRMGDKKRYDDTNQIKTLVLMQVLGDTKTFFANQTELPDVPNFFNTNRVPDAQISDNNAAAYFMIGGSNAQMNALTDMQYKQ